MKQGEIDLTDINDICSIKQKMNNFIDDNKVLISNINIICEHYDKAYVEGKINAKSN